MEGKIKWFDHNKGFGIIINNYNKEFFLHKSNIKILPKLIQENDFVKFDESIINNKTCAINCFFINNNKNNYKNNNKNNYKNKYNKIKNTTDFTPNLDDGDLHLVFTNNKCPDKIFKNDIIIIHNFLDNSINYMENIFNEINNKDIFKLWHGDSHYIANDKGFDWKSNSPTFQLIIHKISHFFNMDIKATRLNYYKDSNDWKPYHHDAAAVKKDKALTQNFTVAIQLGLTRTVSLQHAKNGTIIDFEISNGQCYAFSDKTNIIWKHGIKQSKTFINQPRISIIAWGKI